MPFNYRDYVKAQKSIAPFTSRIITRMLLEADRRLEYHRRFIKRMKEAEASSIQSFYALPRNATIRKEDVKCGKYNCDHLGLRFRDMRHRAVKRKC